MSVFQNNSYHVIGYSEGEAILKNTNTLIGHIENNRVTLADHSVIGHVQGNAIVGPTDSLMATFERGDIFDKNHRVIGHYEGGDHNGAAGAAFLVLFPLYAA